MTDEIDKSQAEAVAEKELREAMTKEIGMSEAEAEALQAEEKKQDDVLKTATMDDIDKAMDLLIAFNRRAEKAQKLMAKLGGNNISPANAMVMKMMGSGGGR